jgi:hypothetical protein
LVRRVRHLRDLIKCAVAKEAYSFANAPAVAGIDRDQAVPDDQVDAARHCLWQLELST